MFHKKYKVKTSTAVKGSERKRIRHMLESQYPSLSTDDLNALIPPKNEIIQTKGMTHNGDLIMLYSSGNNPGFFSHEDKLFPTIYTLWKHPNLLPIVTTASFVFEKISNGADLMAPGIIVNERTKVEFQNLKKGEVCAVRLIGNISAVAVGISGFSSQELAIEGLKGKAVFIKHCYRDNLWLSGDQSYPPAIPDSMDDDIIEHSDEDASIVELTDAINSNSTNVNTCTEQVEETMVQLKLENAETPDSAEAVCTTSEIAENVDVTSFTMDDILKQCFMLALKSNGKKIQLPILTSTFYSSYVLKSCPPELSLDIKKTTYKKLSPFLKSMHTQGLIQVKELSKGVESIVLLNLDHETLKTFHPDPRFKDYLKQQKEEKESAPPPSHDVQENYTFPTVVHLLVVSAQVKDIFEKVKIRKGDHLQQCEVRDAIKNYVKENSLQSEHNPRAITLDPILSHCLLKCNDTRTTLTWEELYDALTSRMSSAYSITYSDNSTCTKKGALEPITVSIATRSGNKKVTLIGNLEPYGINPEKLANYVQTAVAASTSVGQASHGKTGTQVLIQGNQLRYLKTLFFDIYKVPRKYVNGLEDVNLKKKK